VQKARALANGLDTAFPGMLTLDGDRIAIRPEGRPLTRMIARHFDGYEMAQTGHSSAI
jgi:oxygen-independent coproporphyrinogen-3 oxidase